MNAPENGRPAGWTALGLLAAFVQHVLPWLCLLAALHYLRDIVRTVAADPAGNSMWIDIVANVSRTRALAFIFGALGVLYGMQQRNLRTAAVARLRRRITELEGRLDEVRP